MRIPTLIALMLFASACSRGDVTDRALLTGGPDEFSIIPQNPLIIPDTNALPAPGQIGNRADQNPRAQAIIAMGGRP